MAVAFFDRLLLLLGLARLLLHEAVFDRNGDRLGSDVADVTGEAETGLREDELGGGAELRRERPRIGDRYARRHLNRRVGGERCPEGGFRLVQKLVSENAAQAVLAGF